MQPSHRDLWERGGTTALVLGVTGLVFWPALRLGFVWDDHLLLSEATRAGTGLDFRSLLSPYWAELTLTEAVVRYARPVTALSLQLQQAVHGNSPVWFHLFNLLCHLFNVWLLLRLLIERAGATCTAALAALLFALLPLQVEPVAWISGRTDLLACLFGLAALTVHARARRCDRWAMAAGGLLLLSIGSKEVGWIFLPLLALQALLPGSSAPSRAAEAKGLDAPEAPGRASEKARGGLGRWCPIVGAAAVGFAVRVVSLGPDAVSVPGAADPFWLPLLRAATSAGHYLFLLLWPWNPSALPATRALAPPTSLLFWAGVLCLLALPTLVARTWNQRPTVAFGLAWITLGLAPVLNLIPLSAPSPVADRFWYVPLAGVAVAIAGLLHQDAASATHRAIPAARPVQRLYTALLATLVVASAVTTSRRIPDWASDRTLWESEVARHGLRHPLTAKNLGLARLHDGDRKGAQQVWSRALQEGLGGGTSTYYDIGIHLARLLQEDGRHDTAQTLAVQLLRQSPPEPARTALLEFVTPSTTRDRTEDIPGAEPPSATQ